MSIKRRVSKLLAQARRLRESVRRQRLMRRCLRGPLHELLDMVDAALPPECDEIIEEIAKQIDLYQGQPPQEIGFQNIAVYGVEPPPDVDPERISWDHHGLIFWLMGLRDGLWTLPE